MDPMPDRLTPLIQKVEAGQSITRQDVNRLATLSALDLVAFGQRMADQQMQAEEKLTTELEAVWNAP